MRRPSVPAAWNEPAIAGLHPTTVFDHPDRGEEGLRPRPCEHPLAIEPEAMNHLRDAAVDNSRRGEQGGAKPRRLQHARGLRIDRRRALQ